MNVLSTVVATVLCSMSLCAGADTVLDDQFCQVFYELGLGDDGCPAVRANVRSEVRGDGTPTLEMGDPSNPPIFFLHGYPDTSAMWANQFARFCGDDGDFFCVAPSLQNYHPDVARLDDSELLWSVAVEKMHAVITELGLTDITLVIFDAGALIGYQLASVYPELMLRVVGMDIGFAPTTHVPAFVGTLDDVTPFQVAIINAFVDDDDATIQAFFESFRTTFLLPCLDCEISPGNNTGPNGVTATLGWPQYGFVRTDYPWTEAFDTPVADFEFNYMPSFPADAPFLFLWASEHFIFPGQLEWIDARGEADGVSEQMQIEDSDHWVMLRQASQVNDKLASWFAATDLVFAEPSTTMIEPSTTMDSAESGDAAASICTHTALFISMMVFVLKI